MQAQIIAVAIPAYNREQVLINTIQHVLAQRRPADEILVIDQTPEYESKVPASFLGDMQREPFVGSSKRQQICLRFVIEH